MGLGKGGDISSMKLQGPQQKKIGAGLSAVEGSFQEGQKKWDKAAQAEMLSAATATRGIRRAGAAANALARAQVARGIGAARGSGVATGGGLGAASGSVAVQAMREQIAAAAKTEADAQKAGTDARFGAYGLAAKGQTAREAAAQAGLEKEIGIAELEGAAQAGIADAVTQAQLILSQVESGEMTDSAGGATVASYMSALDLSKDEETGSWNSPEQVTAAIAMASASLAQFTGSTINVPDEVWEWLLTDHGPGLVTSFSDGDLEGFLNDAWETIVKYSTADTAWAMGGVTTPGPSADLSREAWLEHMMDTFD